MPTETPTTEPPVTADQPARVADDPTQQGRMTDVLARMAEFLQLNPGGGKGGTLSLDFLIDVSVPVTAELGHATLPIGDILNLEPGSVVELDRDISQPVDLVVCGVLFARGEVVVVEDRFAIRIKELMHSRNKKTR